MPRIAIDTNVFIHLTNPENNPDSHIDQLLSHLAKKQFRLCVDSTKKIANEYTEKLVPMIENANEEGFASYLLKFWLHPDRREEVPLVADSHLMGRIREAIHEADEHADRAFVYVSCEGNCYLVSNDHAHIIGRRALIRGKTKKMRGANSDFITSERAVQLLVLVGDEANGQ